ncbi:MAG: hypothetical protein WDO24_06780 [Pseudomonadota bacterium]
MIVVLLARDTPPVAISDKEPPRVLAVLSVIEALLPVVVSDVAPVTLTAPLSVIAPADDTVRLPVIVEAPRSVADTLTRLALPLLVSVTVCAKLLVAMFNVSAATPVLNVDVPR